MITTNVHHVEAITISPPTKLEKSKAWTRDFTFITNEGSFIITVFANDKTDLATKEALV